MSIVYTKKIFRELPSAVRLFFLKAGVLLIGWLLVYQFILKPAGLLDAWLTDAVLWGTTHVLRICYGNAFYIKPDIFVNGDYAVSITNPCNALELYALYLGFLLCIKTNVKRLLLFSIGGVVFIYILNIFRCAGLAYMNMNSMMSMIDFAHHYAFKMIIYGVIFCMWWWYSRKEAA